MENGEQAISDTPLHGEQVLEYTSDQKTKVFTDNLHWKCSPNYSTYCRS